MNITAILGPERLARGLFWTLPWGLVQGCTPCSPGCRLCWLAAEAHMRQFQKNSKIRDQYQGLTCLANGIPTFNGTVRLRPDRLDLPLRTKKPQVWVFWSDLFHEAVPEPFIDQVLDVISGCPQHIFLAITKRPENMEQKIYGYHPEAQCRALGGGDYLPNLWYLITAETQEQADLRLPQALQIPAAVRGVLVEPCLGAVDVRKYLGARAWGPEFKDSLGTVYHRAIRGFDLVICGGETGRHARPMHPDWPRQLRDDCQTAGVPFFFKSWGEWIERDPHLLGIAPQVRRIGIHGKNTQDLANCSPDMGSEVWVQRVGKTAAGRLLDGRTWEELPGKGVER